MGVGSHDRNMEELAGQDVGGAYASADDSCPGPIGSRVRPLRPAKAELHDGTALRGIAYACCLCGDQGLMVDDIEKCGFHQLGFHDGGDDLHQRLLREDNGSFRNRVDISGEMKMQEVFQEILVKGSGGAKVFDILLIKGQVLHIIDQLLQPGADGISAAIRVAAVKCIKNDPWIPAGLEITLHHRQFIEIGKKRQLHGAHRKQPPFRRMSSANSHYIRFVWEMKEQEIF